MYFLIKKGISLAQEIKKAPTRAHLWPCLVFIPVSEPAKINIVTYRPRRPIWR